MGRVGIDDIEDLRSLRLDADDRRELLTTQSECTFVFTTAEGWPAGVVMSFLYEEGRFWLTAVRGRAHAEAIGQDPRVTLVVSNSGTALPGRRMLAVRGIALRRDDEETKRRMLPRLAAKLAPGDPGAMVRLLDSPNRVIFEVHPVKIAVSHDSRKMPGDGRGGSGSGSAERADSKE